MRYCITLDTDTQLPRDAAKTLIGIALHPLNQPQIDLTSRRVTEGYGILQPRVSVTMSSAAGSVFARVYAGHTGVDPYTTAVSDTYQDLFEEGVFAGKGLYHVDAFKATLDGRVPENALLSHDLFEGLHARVALVTDLEVVDDFPATVLAHARRQRRWVRGDWQILWWLFPWVPATGGVERNHLPLISRWKILDNLRRSLLAPALLGLLVIGWTTLPGRPWFWTTLTLVVLGTPVLLTLARLATFPWLRQPLAVLLRRLAEDLETSVAQAILTLMLLPYHAWEMAHAIVLTLIRLVITQRRLLEWETAASVAVRLSTVEGRTALRTFIIEMAASPLIAIGILATVAAVAPASLSVASSFIAPVGRGAGGRVPPQPPGGAAGLGPQRPRPAPPSPDRQKDVALLRAVRRSGQPLAAARQLPGDAGRRTRAPDVAHEHRHGSAVDAGGARPRLHRLRRARRATRRRPGQRRTTGALRRTSAELVRDAHAGGDVAAICLDGR